MDYSIESYDMNFTIPAVNKKGEKVNITISDKIGNLKLAVKTMLKLFDKNRNGVLEKDELEKLYERVGDEMTKEEIDTSIEEYLKDWIKSLETWEEGEPLDYKIIIAAVEMGYSSSEKAILALIDQINLSKDKAKKIFLALTLSQIMSLNVVYHLEEITDIEKIASGITNLARSKDKSVADYALTALSNMGHAAKSAVPVLIDMFKDLSEEDILKSIYGNPPLELPGSPHLARVLGKLGDNSFPELKEASKNNEKNVRAMTALSLGEMIKSLSLKKGLFDEKFEILIDMLNEKEDLVRGAAVFAFGVAGKKIAGSPYAEKILTILERIKKDDASKNIRLLAEKTILQIALPGITRSIP